MKTIGLIGGDELGKARWVTIRIINRTVKEQLGGLHSAKCVLYSVDFQEIEACQSSGDWDQSARILSDAAQRLERAGADFIVICTNTMHKVVPQIQEATHLPILHIAEETASELRKQGIGKVALLGTKYTMEQDFYKEKLLAAGIEVLIPCRSDRSLINEVIYEELCLGRIEKRSREEFLRIIDSLTGQGAQGIILGCTEIGMLVKPKDTWAVLFDTTEIHARNAALLSIE